MKNYRRNLINLCNLMILFVSQLNLSAQVTAEMIVTLEDETANTANIDYFDTWSYAKQYDWIETPDGISPYVMISCRGGFNEDWEYGVEAPDGTLSSKFTTGLTTWNGWTQALFDLVSSSDENDITPSYIPVQITSALRNDEKVMAIDVYYEDLDPEHTFDVIAEYIDEEEKFKTETIGIKMQIRLQNAENYPENKDTWSFLTKEAYITEANTWQTLYFTEDDVLEMEANPLAPEVDGDAIDRIFFDLNYGYDAAVASNYYLKNFRIVPSSETGIKDIKNGRNRVTIYPNPTTDYMKIKGLTNVGRVDILDVSSRFIKSVSMDNTNIIDVSELQAGAYLLRVNNTTRMFIKK